MSVSDPIADLLTRIRNAIMARQTGVDIPFSSIKFEITKLMKAEGFIKGYKVQEAENKKELHIVLKYDLQNNSVINGLQRVSHPGRRVYVKRDSIPKVLGGLGIAILSTSKGVLSDKLSRQENVGGELLCNIW